MAGVYGLTDSPIIIILKKRKRMRRTALITTLGDWFNVVGADEFRKALNDGVIVQSKNDPGMYVLKNGTVNNSGLS